MNSVPGVSGDDFVRAVASVGYQLDHTRGSHMMLYCAGRNPLSVPRHRELARGTLRALLRRAGITEEEFIALLRR